LPPSHASIATASCSAAAHTASGALPTVYNTMETASADPPKIPVPCLWSHEILCSAVLLPPGSQRCSAS